MDSDSGGAEEPDEKHVTKIMKKFKMLRGQDEDVASVHSKLPK